MWAWLLRPGVLGFDDLRTQGVYMSLSRRRIRRTVRYYMRLAEYYRGITVDSAAFCTEAYRQAQIRRVEAEASLWLRRMVTLDNRRLCGPGSG